MPGAFELPLAAKMFAASGGVDAVIALGCVIRGDTPHFDYVAGECARGLMDAGLATGVPVIFGVLTTETWRRPKSAPTSERMNKGRESMEAALEMIHLLAPPRAHRARLARRSARDEDRCEETLMAQNLKFNPASARRAVARKLAMQALYRWQVNAGPWQDVLNEFAAEEDMRKADRGYFNQLITDICGGSEALDTALADLDGSQTQGARSGGARGALGRRARVALGARRAVSRRHQRGRGTRQAFRRHRQPQVRQRRARRRRP